MAGVQLSVTVDSEPVRRALEGLVAASRDLREPFEEVGSMLVAATQRRFEDEETPSGDPWPELAESTQRRRVTKSRRRGTEHILRVQGHLYRSITYVATSTELAVGSNRQYAALHQLGGTDDMPPGPAAVPARPYLGISADDEREIGEILLRHLAEGAS